MISIKEPCHQWQDLTTKSTYMKKATSDEEDMGDQDQKGTKVRHLSAFHLSFRRITKLRKHILRICQSNRKKLVLNSEIT